MSLNPGEAAAAQLVCERLLDDHSRYALSVTAHQRVTGLLSWPWRRRDRATHVQMDTAQIVGGARIVDSGGAGVAARQVWQGRGDDRVLAAGGRITTDDGRAFDAGECLQGDALAGGRP